VKLYLFLALLRGLKLNIDIRLKMDKGDCYGDGLFLFKCADLLKFGNFICMMFW